METIITSSRTITIYTTTNGREFDSLQSAENHQKVLDAPKVYIVVLDGYFRAFSTRVLAEEFCNEYKNAPRVYELPIDCKGH